MAQRYEITDMVFRNVGGALLAHPSAFCTVKDLQGNNLTVYQAETGSSTFTNPLTSDSNGQIEGWIEAPDFDIAVTGSGISSYTQKVRQSPPGTFAVESYGAKIDGSTNDATAVQAALTAIQTAGKGKLTASKPGVCKLNSALTYAGSDLEMQLPGVTFDFSGASATVLISVAGSQAASVSLTANAVEGATSLTVAAGGESGFAAGDYVRVGSNTTYDPGRTDQPIGEIAVVLSTASGTINLRSPLMGGAYNTASSAFVAKLTPAANITLRGGKIKGSGAGGAQSGIKVATGRRVRVHGTEFENCEATGVELRDVVDGVVDGISVNGSNAAASGYGVSFVLACQDCTVSNSHFRDCRHAASHAGVGASTYGLPRRITWVGNHVWDTASTGDAFDTHAAAEDISFIGNTVYDCSSQGFNIECAKASVIGNTVIRSASHAIGFHNETAYATEFRCIGNKIVNPALRGISVTSATTAGAGATVRAMIISGNEIYNSTTQGIIVTSTDTWRWEAVSVTGNVLRSVQSTTAALNVVKADSPAISGNVIDGVVTNSTGIRVSDTNKASIVGNTIKCASATGSIGVWASATTADAVISGNTVDGAATGVNLASDTTNTLVQGNNVRGCTAPLTLSTGAGNVAKDNIGATSGGTATVASAATITLPASEGDYFIVSGTTTITSVTASYAGRRVTIKFSGILTFTDGSNLTLAGNFVTTADDTITLVCDGTNWLEASRSVN